MESKPVSIYIHFPFCVKKCAYCAFFSVSGGNDEIYDAYTDAVIKRLRSIPRHRVKTVYFGGGTPTVLGAERLCRVLGAVSDTQEVEQDAEITLESNPGTVNSDDFYKLSAAGFNRLSIGLQSADDEALKVLGRIHDLKAFLDCYDGAAKYFSNISTDIIFALPYNRQSGKPSVGLHKTLEILKSIQVPHISAYSLILEENTPLSDYRNQYAFPDENGEEAEYNYICSFLSDSGYGHYEISSFALPGYESRHNIGYWKRESYIGVGPAAHSFYRNRRFSAPPDIGLFIRSADKPFMSDTDFAAAAEITADEAEEERIMLGLRTSDGVKLLGEKLKYAEKLADAGYGTIRDGIFSLNDKGFRVSNFIISGLI
ncbi:MAG: radical SAM family heme chaperone HemW [Eubacteriales bacterium]|nr:radical SAM family heme chaperone HemW [Eubacteriales bacterium]